MIAQWLWILKAPWKFDMCVRGIFKSLIHNLINLIYIIAYTHIMLSNLEICFKVWIKFILFEGNKKETKNKKV